MTAFAAAIDVLFADPNIGRDAIWRAGGSGAGTTVRVIWRKPDQVAAFGDGRFVAKRQFIDVRTAEIALLQPGDTFEIASETLIVLGEPTRDDEGLVRTAELRAS